MKTGNFRKVNFGMEKMSSYGHYQIVANYRGKKINDARRHCCMMIVSEYEKQKRGW